MTEGLKQVKFNKTNKSLIYEILMPKSWVLADFSPTENLIEIEDNKTFNKFWIPIFELFKKDFILGRKQKIINLEEKYMFDAYLHEIKSDFRRKRYYLQAIFKMMPKPNLQEFPKGINFFKDIKPIKYDEKDLYFPHLDKPYIKDNDDLPF